MVPDIRTVHFWSDGCTAQFKDKYPFARMTSLANNKIDNHVYLIWSYFKSHHGKGSVVRSPVYKDVKAGIVVIDLLFTGNSFKASDPHFHQNSQFEICTKVSFR